MGKYPPIEKISELAYESGVDLREYVGSNPPRAFSGGKVKNKEYMKLVENMDKLVEETEQRVGIQPSCQKGCAACCNHSIIANGLDVDLILNYLERNYDYETLKMIKQRIVETAEILDKKIGPTPRNSTDMIKLMNDEQTTKTDYFTMKLPCPLLSEENTCMVYPVRPSPCWSYRAYGDPQDCENTHDVTHSVVYVGHERYFLSKRNASTEAGTIPRSKSYLLPGLLPQKLRDGIR